MAAFDAGVLLGASTTGRGVCFSTGGTAGSTAGTGLCVTTLGGGGTSATTGGSTGLGGGGKFNAGVTGCDTSFFGATGTGRVNT